ncbi:hypothetical protein BP6252_06744 [Coleophoma cylindrospora]|uniref:Zn(2)-C6 fungal-type domain-containing protein n=1 Tax=Coleophoma cylindrospora TaxID=1849047 RepID=A0A3D8RFL8_9HELO|nr:hypothetical protein BP6252_06744 [Coleophoma cylindrospora]
MAELTLSKTGNTCSEIDVMRTSTKGRQKNVRKGNKLMPGCAWDSAPSLTSARLTTTTACDLCFSKKIKCNMVQPECSNCILYKTECRTTNIRRRADPPRLRPSTKTIPDAQENSKVKERLDKIERQLQNVIENTVTAQAQASTESISTINKVINPSTKHGGSKSPPWTFDPVRPTLYQGLCDEDLSLPPIHNIMPMVDNYFNTHNNVTLLFDEAQFMPLLARWYAKNPKRDRATWAAILVVIALGSRSLTPGTVASRDLEERAELESYCMRNAQSVMSEFATRDEDLLGMQVLLGLAILFYDCSDTMPASILSGTAMKLAHRLQLHSRSSAQLFTAEEVQQRSRVFWNAYILDKDLSLRAKAPSVQCDADIDIPLPPIVLSDGAGIITSKDGHSHLNLFRLRVDLAHIEGKIYDLLYSSRSIKAPKPERQRRVTSLQAMLDHWYARIPPAFKIEMASATHSSRLDAESQLLEQGCNPGFCNGRSGSKSIFYVYESRPSTGRQGSCVHFSALIVILANILISPGHESVSLDLQIATTSVRLFEQLLDIVQSTKYEPLQRIIMDLYQSAARVVDEVRLGGSNRANDLNTSLPEGDLDIFSERSDFPEFQWNEDGLGGLDFDTTFNPFVGVGEESSLPSIEFGVRREIFDSLGGA